MLDTFKILTTSGVVLWSRSYASISPSIINNFVSDVFIEEKVPGSAAKGSQSAAANTPYQSEQHTLKWAIVKELGIIFVAVYRSLLHLSWVDKFVDNIRAIFIGLYAEQLKQPHTTLLSCQEFDNYFDQQVRALEKSGIQVEHSGTEAPNIVEGKADDFERDTLRNDVSANELSPGESPGTSRPVTPSTGHLAVPKGLVGKMSRRQRKAQSAASAVASSGDESPRGRGKGNKKALKKGRKWDADGMATEDDDVQLDYSISQASDSEAGVEKSSALEQVDSSTWGSKTSKGQFVLKDLDDEVQDLLESAQENDKAAAAALKSKSSGGLVGSGLSAISGMLRNVVGGKVLTKEDLDKAMKGMEDHLLKKNVAREAAVRLCEGVEKELIGVKTGSFESINTRIQAAMEASLTKMLTPTSSLDLLREIDAITRPSRLSGRTRRPYVMSIVGVNGVGKSTNLSKICYFLLQNKYKVLIVAGDTFRSGAVEQLAVHVRNLKELTTREGGRVELYQKGYGKDAAAVAKDAVTHAAGEDYDVVLIDTAGRRHNDQRLMSSLEKFAKFAQPDKILMVGEALVGTDSVAQARNFNAAFGVSRSLDGFIISKCDTVGDMVGTLVSLVHATNVPVLFVGVGQHYSDLRNFSVKWAVEKLLSSV
ncbi:related to signal recognition particle receptor alpha subunit (SRP receptor alpha-subunit) [Cephalotrichum gorgonifer]|uniref:Signal recognition particle receptor subunit alpha homolog n=1 Tax=Cephalotrichum gorgonifer TaxID=2041049 RepID=A0AAE8N2R1_9PEZI|nr:related to signal recognition particle receptor alpha subunit (SRP receptor alpha-subunit) [Cephalotrichum gorgonifer]